MAELPSVWVEGQESLANESDRSKLSWESFLHEAVAKEKLSSASESH